MSIASELQTLKTNIENVQNTLYTNLVGKGVTDISESDTLSTLADKVNDVVGGGGGSGDCPSAIDFSSIGYDTEFSNEINADINADVAYSKTLYDAWNPSNTSASNLYKNDTKLVYAPHIDTSNVTNMEWMFANCSRLTSVPQLDTSKTTIFNYMFNECYSLTTIPQFDTSKVESMYGMFNGCYNLTSIPQLNTSNVTQMTNMFNECYNLTTIPQLDTSKNKSMYRMFYECSSLTSVPELNTSNVTDMSYVFQYCSRLTTVPQLDTSNVTQMGRMFQDCNSLTSVPELDTSKVTSMSQMFYNCDSLTSIEGISVKSMGNIGTYDLFGYATNKSIRKFLIKDIGYNSKQTSIDISYVTNWGVNSDTITDARQSLIDSLITYSYDRATTGYSTCTIKLSSTTKALLTTDELAQITAKGYTVA